MPMEQTNARHVYELRLYQVNDGKMDARIARFGDHTDAIFKRHNMKSLAFGVHRIRRSPTACSFTYLSTRAAKKQKTTGPHFS